MKKILFISLVSFVVNGFFAQTLPTTENYIYSRVYLQAVTTETPNAKQYQEVIYYDELGRPKQAVSIKSTPSGHDLVTPINYDSFGRNLKTYLPIPQSTLNGNIHQVGESNVNAYYSSSNAYYEDEMESFSINRLKQSAFPGEDWAKNSGHTVRYNYDLNLSSDNVKKYTTITTWDSVNKIFTSSVPSSGNYGNGELYKYSITDEDNITKYAFKDQLGNIVLIRKSDGIQFSDTYYIYNEYNLLAYIVSPLASVSASLNPAILDNLCYQYRYDDQKRLVEKKLPGKGWEYMVYDQQDRLVASKDALNQWLFMKYDMFGRVVYTGLAHLGESRKTVQQSLDNLTGAAALNNEARHGVGFYSSNMLLFYSNISYPISFSKVLSVNYYDTYPAGTPAIPTTILTQAVLPQDAQNSNISTKSLSTASYIKNIEDDRWTKTYVWYDTKGRDIGRQSINHLGGFTKTESELDFAGMVKKTNTYHSRASQNTEVTIEENFTYDSQNRLMAHGHKVNNNPEVIIADNEYNDLSQLQYKSVDNGLQAIDYTYNIRGWLTGVNNPSDLGDDLFAYRLKYTNPDYSTLTDGKYNGNIAEADWITASDETLRRYTYQYDGLNRLKKGIYSEPENSLPQNNFFNEEFSYDLNGNIKTLQRFRMPKTGTTTPVKIDDLVYNYENSGKSNRLHQIVPPSGVANNPSGYNALQYPFMYDNNGNMKSNMDKGIDNIYYNHLNLPREVAFDESFYVWDEEAGDFAEYNINSAYLYRADGIKLQKIFSAKGSENDSGVNNIFRRHTEYLDGFQYEGEIEGFAVQEQPTVELKFFPTEGGYYDYANNQYIYQYKDQVGNVRLSYYNDGGSSGAAVIDKETNFYPFGLEHGFYNQSFPLQPSYKYGYQEQEKQEDTGWSSFKWRNYDPAMGRFFNIDPLSEKYAYQSHYNFSENRVVDGRELEGLEFHSMQDYNDFIDENPGWSYDIENEQLILMGPEQLIDPVVLKGKGKQDQEDHDEPDGDALAEADFDSYSPEFQPLPSPALDFDISLLDVPYMLLEAIVGTAIGAGLEELEMDDELADDVMAAASIGFSLRRGKIGTLGAKSPVRYDKKVRERGLQDPVGHNFPYSFDEHVLDTTPIPKKNGYKMYQKEGSVNNTDGVFEIGVKNDGVIDHRVFRSNKQKR
ncbi:MAG: RHS repeat-associated core domain-containing protein [Kaistella sp.]|nr:RHS repeat-associated core domain-containing protein [Kaistella sp.]